MPRIDALLTAMLTNRADAVSLSDGDIAHIIKAGARHPLTRQPLGEGQLLLLLREMCPADVRPSLGTGDPIEFIYANSDGPFITRVVRENGSLAATVSRAPAAAGSNGSVNGTVANTVIASPVVSTPAPPEPASAARSEIERLLRVLVEDSASDLHLRAGEPPILRVDGELRRMENLRPLTSTALETMLMCIMPERNQAEYRESNDTDFAYAIDGLARFRANAFRDHDGAAAVFRVIPATVVTVEELGLSPEVQNLCYLTKGLVLVTGPTGSGKSTTLGGMIDLINRTRNDHVLTIEDPIEFVHKSKKCVITQRQVGVHTGSFKAALRGASGGSRHCPRR